MTQTPIPSRSIDRFKEADLPRWSLGNDIVHLADPRHMGKSADERFLRRVFSETEREDIRKSEELDRALWIRWAGKEAAFKTLSKSLGTPPTFIHSSFHVSVFRPTRPGPGQGRSPPHPMTRFGQVRHGDLVFPLRIEVAGTALHAVTWDPSVDQGVPDFSWGFIQIQDVEDDWREALRGNFSPAEWDCISHQASALARLAARRSIASSFAIEEGDVEIGCGPGMPGRRIPRVLVKGEETPVDLTLSHHGQLLAWAFLVSPGPRPAA